MVMLLTMCGASALYSTTTPSTSTSRGRAGTGTHESCPWGPYNCPLRDSRQGKRLPSLLRSFLYQHAFLSDGRK